MVVFSYVSWLAMDDEKTGKETKNWCGSGWTHMHGHGCGSALYGLGFLGALYYYLTTATSLWMGFIGVLKAIFWPAFLVYSAMKYLGM